MKLQGKNSKKLNKSISKKMKETLKGMEIIRKEDSIQLRQLINQRITFLKEQKKNCIEKYRNLKEQLRIFEIKNYQIDGALTALEDLIKE